MPRPRIIIHPKNGGVHYHCISRVVDRNFVFGAHERDVFRKTLRQVEAFTGVQALTWTILSNHFHLLLEVPPPPATPLTHDEILQRCRALYSPDQMIAIEWEFAEAERAGGTTLEKLHSRYLRRMWDLSEFVKTLKQKFTLWFNRTHDRVGTLWESRYKSVLVEGSWNCLLRVAAYIDLNAVRAGLVDDPKDYPWCGYGEAVAGDRSARKGLAAALADIKPSATWRDVAPSYRKILFGIGEETGNRAGISREEVAKVWEAGGRLSLAQILRCRVRHLSDGLAIGTAPFIEAIFRAKRSTFSEKRKEGARKLPRGEWDGLCSARALRVNPISPSGDG
jgi:putative transposase